MAQSYRDIGFAFCRLSKLAEELIFFDDVGVDRCRESSAEQNQVASVVGAVCRARVLMTDGTGSQTVEKIE